MKVRQCTEALKRYIESMMKSKNKDLEPAQQKIYWSYWNRDKPPHTKHFIQKQGNALFNLAKGVY